MAPALDFTPLTTPMSREEVAAWKAQAKASGVAWASATPAQIIGLVVVIPVMLVFLGVVSLFVSDVASTGVQSGSPLTIVLPVVTLVGVFALVAFVIVKAVRGTARRWELWARMDRFARANGMTFSPRDSSPSYPGAIFQLGSARQALDHLVSATGRFFDIGNFRYTTGSGKNRSTRVWGFMAFSLDRRLPHMMLDSKANNGIFGSNLPATFDKSQILSLEGDFDRYFTLYCPTEYERDALYVFTPDLMALLIDEAAPFDVEIVDDWMFVYSQAPFRTGDANVYARLFRIIDTVGAKALSQTDRYVDARVGDFAADVVAPQGSRLKRGVPVVAIIVVALVLVFWMWPVLGGMLLR